MGRSTSKQSKIKTGRVSYPQTVITYRCRNCKAIFRNCRSYGGHKGKCKIPTQRNLPRQVDLLDNRFSYEENMVESYIPNEVQEEQGKNCIY
jgi:hypothetical protein